MSFWKFGGNKKLSSECRTLVEDFKKNGVNVYERATEEELERYIDLTRRWVLYQIEYYCQTVEPLSEDENGERVWLNRKLHGCKETERKPLPVVKTPYDRKWGVTVFTPGSHQPSSEGVFQYRYWRPPVPIIINGEKFEMMSPEELAMRKIGFASQLCTSGRAGPAPENMRDIVDAVLLTEVIGSSFLAKNFAEAHKYDYFGIIEGKR